MCYTYDSLTRVTERTVKTLEDVLVGEESYEYDAAGNITGAAEGSYVCDVNNRLTEACGSAIAYDMDGNMTSGPLGGTTATFAYDSGNRLIQAGDCAYTYDAEDLRIRSEEGGTQTEYTYNPQAKLSQLLMRTKDGSVTKYVYGLGLIGEETGGEFRTYHFDSRGSTVAVTSGMGNVTNTFAYDAYGRLTEKMGLDDILFCYNGKYGVITEPNGLVYMRARYYSPELRRFINADVVAGEITNAITLNRYAYANGNPISNVDPLGLTAERGDGEQVKDVAISMTELWDNFNGAVDGFELVVGEVKFVKDGKYINIKGDRAVLQKYGIRQTRIRADNIKNFEGIAKFVNSSSAVSSALKSKSNWALAGITIVIETAYDMSQYDDFGDKLIIGSYDIVSGVVGSGLSLAGGAWVGAKVGSALSPGWGTLVGLVAGGLIGLAYDVFVDEPLKEYVVVNLIEG